MTQPQTRNIFYVNKIVEHLDKVNEAMDPVWPALTDDQKVQVFLDAAATINPEVQEVADTLVATINRVTLKKIARDETLVTVWMAPENDDDEPIL
tara:strand:- start:260 stop:544 length:285 start_codon:yes stop_codon:yes gene_type:complete